MNVPRVSPRLPLLAALALSLAAAARADDLAPYRPLPEPGVGTFVGSIVPTATPLGTNVLHLRVTHRFTQPVNDASGHDLWGLDSSADIGLGVDWGFSPNLEASLFRSKYLDDYEGAVKFRWLAQSEAVPLSVSTRVGVDYRSDPDWVGEDTSYFGQLILQRAFGPVSIVVTPTWISDTPGFENVINIPVGLVVRAGESWTILGEVVPRNPDNDEGHTAWLVGVEKRVPGHTFGMTFSNSRATTVDMAMASDFPPGFEPQDMRIGFHITRRWKW